MKMKVLHIGKNGNMERFSAPDAHLYQLDRVDMESGLAEDAYISLAGDADFIVADAISPVTEKLMAGMPNLKLIHSEGVAFNAIDTAAAAEKGIYVCNCKGMNAVAVAEQAILLMVGLLRNVAVNDRAVREGKQINAKLGYMASGNLRELADCRVGLIGFGDIAKETAKLLTAYGVQNISYYKPNRLPEADELACGVRFLPLDELLADSDIVSLHLPVNAATQGTVNAEFFAKMKQGAFLINTARGELVDDAALADALASGKLAGAGLDTLSNEPVQPDHPLLNLPEASAERILFSPHIGGITASSFRRGYGMIWEDIADVIDGKTPKRVVNK